MGERFRTHRRSDHQKPKAQLEIEYLMTKRRQDGRRTLATRNSGEHHNGNHKHQQHSHGDAHPERKARLHHGRTTGSGRAIANLGSVGAEIFPCRRHQAELIGGLESIRSTGALAAGEVADVSKPDDVKRIFKQADQSLGGLDIFISKVSGRRC